METSTTYGNGDVRTIAGWLGRGVPRALLALILFAGASIACGESTDPVGPDEPSEIVDRVTLPQAGGATTLFGGAVQLEVPAGAVSSDTEITVTVAPVVGLDGALAGAVFDFEPDGLTFAEPIAVRVEFDPTALGALEAADLRLHEYTTGTPEMNVGSRVDIDASVVTGSISGFSVHGVGVASDAELQASIDELWDRWRDESRPQAERDATAAALYQDMRSLYPRLSAQCAASNQIPVIRTKLLGIAKLVERAQFSGYDAQTRQWLNDACGAFLHPDSTTIVIEPDSATLAIGDAMDLEATVLGPPARGRELVGGAVIFAGGDPDVATVDQQSGRIEAHGVGQTGVGAYLELLAGAWAISTPTNGGADITVVGPIVMDLTPVEGTQVVLAYQQWTVFDAVVRDSTTGNVIDEVDVGWAATVDAHVDISLGSQGEGIPIPNGRKIEARDPGSTEVGACAEFGPSRTCALIPLRVVWNLSGTWTFNESFTTQLPPPETETCTVTGTVRLEQVRDRYTGTSDEDVRCVYDAGDGSGPQPYNFQTTALLVDGVMTGNQYAHRVILGGEECTAEGRVSGNLSPGDALFANGTLRCVDSDGYVSTGTTTGEYTGAGSRHVRIDPGSE